MNNEGSIGSVRLLGPIDGLVNARVAEAYLLYDLCVMSRNVRLPSGKTTDVGATTSVFLELDEYR